MGIKKVIITLGENGLFYSDGKEEYILKLPKIKPLILQVLEMRLEVSALLKGKK